MHLTRDKKCSSVSEECFETKTFYYGESVDEPFTTKTSFDCQSKCEKVEFCNFMSYKDQNCKLFFSIQEKINNTDLVTGPKACFCNLNKYFTF